MEKLAAPLGRPPHGGLHVPLAHAGRAVIKFHKKLKRFAGTQNPHRVGERAQGCTYTTESGDVCIESTGLVCFPCLSTYRL